jgi:hypothetical protein
MAALRIGATLAHALPGVRLRLGDRERGALLEVAGDGPCDATRRVTPCAFRAAVARAHRRTAEGVRMTFLGLPLGHDPVVAVGVPPGGKAFGAGMLAVPIAGAASAVQAFATTLSPDACRHVIAARAHPAMSSTVRVVHDEATDVTLVHTTVPVATAAQEPSAVLTEVLAVVATEELVAQMPSSARNG